MLRNMSDPELWERVYIARESNNIMLAQAIEEILRLRSEIGTAAKDRLKAGKYCAEQHEKMRMELEDLHFRCRTVGEHYDFCRFPDGPCGHKVEEGSK